MRKTLEKLIRDKLGEGFLKNAKCQESLRRFNGLPAADFLTNLVSKMSAEQLETLIQNDGLIPYNPAFGRFAKLLERPVFGVIILHGETQGRFFHYQRGFVELDAMLYEVQRSALSVVLMYNTLLGLRPAVKDMSRILREQYGETTFGNQNENVTFFHQVALRLDPLLKNVKPDNRVGVNILFGGNVFPPRQNSMALEERSNVECVLNWATSERVRAAGNVVVIVEENLCDLDPRLVRHPAVKTIELGLPDKGERLLSLYIENQKKLIPLSPSLSNDGQDPLLAVANLTGGIDDPSLIAKIRELDVEGFPLDEHRLIDIRREVMKKTSQGAIVIMNAEGNFEMIGGLEAVKKELRRIARLIRSGKVSGKEFRSFRIMFAGPTGVSKTHLAMLFGLECGLTVFYLSEIKSMWYGQSLQNLRRALRLIRQNAPAVLLLDESEQMYPRAGVGREQHSVDADLLREWLEVLGKEGELDGIVVISITNYPNHVDPRFLYRRLGTVIPILAPTRQEAREVFSKLFARRGYNVEFDAGTWASFVERSAVDFEGRPIRFTGVEIGEVVNRAVRYAMEADAKRVEAEHVVRAFDSYLPRTTAREVLSMSYMALFHADDQNLVAHYAPEFPEAFDGRGRLDKMRLERLIWDLEARVAAR